MIGGVAVKVAGLAQEIPVCEHGGEAGPDPGRSKSGNARVLPGRASNARASREGAARVGRMDCSSVVGSQVRAGVKNGRRAR